MSVIWLGILGAVWGCPGLSAGVSNLAGVWRPSREFLEAVLRCTGLGWASRLAKVSVSVNMGPYGGPNPTYPAVWAGVTSVSFYQSTFLYFLVMG